MKVGALSVHCARGVIFLSFFCASVSWAETVRLRASVANEDLFRGIQFFEGAPVEVGLEIDFDNGFYGGVVTSASLSEIDDRETDFHAGWYHQGRSGGLWSATVYRYTFSGAASEFDFTELDFQWQSSAWTASLGFSPDVYGTDDSSLYAVFEREFELPRNISLSAWAGYYNFFDSNDTFYPEAPSSYSHYGLEVTKSWRTLAASILWSGASSDADLLFGAEAADDRVLLTLSFETEIWNRNKRRAAQARLRR